MGLSKTEYKPLKCVGSPSWQPKSCDGCASFHECYPGVKKDEVK